MCLGESMSVTAEVSDEVIRVGQYPGSLTATCTFVIGEQLGGKGFNIHSYTHAYMDTCIHDDVTPMMQTY